MWGPHTVAAVLVLVSAMHAHLQLRSLHWVTVRDVQAFWRRIGRTEGIVLVLGPPLSRSACRCMHSKGMRGRHHLDRYMQSTCNNKRLLLTSQVSSGAFKRLEARNSVWIVTIIKHLSQSQFLCIIKQGAFSLCMNWMKERKNTSACYSI
jgi:hypothetical protein